MPLLTPNYIHFLGQVFWKKWHGVCFTNAVARLGATYVAVLRHREACRADRHEVRPSRPQKHPCAAPAAQARRDFRPAIIKTSELRKPGAVGRTSRRRGDIACAFRKEG